MLELSLLVNLVGLIGSSMRSRIKVGNPFQVYFIVWFSLLMAYYFTSDSFYHPSDIFFFVILLVSLFWLLGLHVIIVLARGAHRHASIMTLRNVAFNNRLFFVSLLACTLVAPLFFLRATDLSGGESIVTVVGYIALRRAMTEDLLGYGWISYFPTLAFVLSSIAVVRHLKSEISLIVVIFSVSLSIYFAFLSTGRTFFLLLFSMIVFPLILMGYVRIRGLLITGLILAIFFVLVAFMTAKGLSENLSISENAEMFFYSLRGYLISPIVAMGQLFDTTENFALGSNTFRVVFAVANKIGFDVSVPQLIRDVAFVPDETNVYTVFDPYFRDFSVSGILVFSLVILLFHSTLYIKMLKNSGPYMFVYAAALFALVMQFFQDMYFSLLSQWAQIFFWYWLLVKRTQPRQLTQWNRAQ